MDKRREGLIDPWPRHLTDAINLYIISVYTRVVIMVRMDRMAKPMDASFSLFLFLSLSLAKTLNEIITEYNAIVCVTFGSGQQLNTHTHLPLDDVILFIE